MPLIDCPECKKPISDSASSCPSCGYPVAGHGRKQGSWVVTTVALVLAVVGIIFGAISGNVFAIVVGFLALVFPAIRFLLVSESSNKRMHRTPR